MLSFWPQFKYLQLSSFANNAERQKPLRNASEISKKSKRGLEQLGHNNEIESVSILKKKSMRILWPSEYSSEKSLSLSTRKNIKCVNCGIICNCNKI